MQFSQFWYKSLHPSARGIIAGNDKILYIVKFFTGSFSFLHCVAHVILLGRHPGEENLKVEKSVQLLEYTQRRIIANLWILM